MITCKRCHANEIVKNGLVRGQICYKCKKCGLNFIKGDRHVKDSVAVKKALVVILYSLGKASFGMLAKVFGHSRSLKYRWISEEAAKHTESVISGEIKEIEFDEMWHFIQSKKQKMDHQSSGSWIKANYCLGYRQS